MQVTTSRKWAGEDISYFQMYIYIYIYIHSYLNSLKQKSSIHFLEERSFMTCQRVRSYIFNIKVLFYVTIQRPCGESQCPHLNIRISHRLPSGNRGLQNGSQKNVGVRKLSDLQCLMNTLPDPENTIPDPVKVHAEHVVDFKLGESSP